MSLLGFAVAALVIQSLIGLQIIRSQIRQLRLKEQELRALVELRQQLSRLLERSHG